MRRLLAGLALLAVLYWLGFLVFACGSEQGTGVGDAVRGRGVGEVHFAG